MDECPGPRKDNRPARREKSHEALFRRQFASFRADDPGVDEDEAEEVARQVSEETGLDDRPRCDPRVIAAGYLDLELLPWPNTPPRLVEGVIWYPSNAPRDAQAYFIAHECGHELVRTERLEGAQLERVCSRIGCALLLPRRAFLRDVRALGADLDQLHELWPLASRWVIARRLEELGLYRATRDRRGRISIARVSDDDPPTPPACWAT